MFIEAFDLAWLSLTYQCNSKCKWCYAASNYYELARNKKMDPANIDGIIKLIFDLKIPKVTLIGGEPTLYPELIKVIDGLSIKRIIVGMVSNGRRLNDRDFTKDLKQSGLSYTTFSIEGSCPEVHDGTTQISGSFQQAMDGIENARLEGLHVTTNTLISRLNFNDLENMVDLLISKGITKMSYNICGVCVSKEANNDNMLDPRDAVKAFERVYLYAKSKNVKIRLVTPMPKCNFNPKLIDELKKERGIPGGPCHIVHGRNFVIDYNGDIVPCTHLTGYPMLNVFNGDKTISKDEFIKAYNSNNVAKFREDMARYPSQKCVGCLENCVGGCPIYWIKLNPDEQIKGFKT